MGTEGDRTSGALDEKRGLTQVFVQPSPLFFGFAEKKGTCLKFLPRLKRSL
jgi:hypothetical protein